MFLSYKNTNGYKEHFIYFIAFDFGRGIKIIDLIANMKTDVL